MARMARLIVPHYPHHITQRGNRRQKTFFSADWRWSSVHAHLRGRDDQIVSVRPMQSLIENWLTYLQVETPDSELETIRQHARTGRPLGDDGFVKRLEEYTGRA